MQIVAVVEFERYMTHTGIFEVVVGKLNYWEEPCPVILLPIYKNTKISFYGTVLLFCLIVCLRVKRDGESFFNAKEVIEQRSKLGHENRSSVTYNRV